MKTRYTNKRTNLEIVCIRCSRSFFQRPDCHLRGQGCPRCPLHSYISKSETAWLDRLGIADCDRQKYVPGIAYSVDALVDNVVYEFYGTYWHGDPRMFARDKRNELAKTTMGQLYDRTLEREKKLRLVGYEVRFVWEIDWKAGTLFSEVHPTFPRD